MQLLEVLILACVQGIAEFLPISSSGHLVLASQFLGDGEADAGLNILLHAGTLASIVVFYRRELWALLGRDRRLVPLLAIGTLPAVVVGLVAKRRYEEVLESPAVAAWMLLVTAGLLWWSTKRGHGTRTMSSLSAGSALVVGVAQAFALLPGISRSGATIVAGMAVGLERRSAATWAFLLAVPAIGGAAVLEGFDLLRGSASQLTLVNGLAGFLVAFLVGLVSLQFLLRVIAAGRLHWFALWCAAVGAAALLFVV